MYLSSVAEFSIQKKLTNFEGTVKKCVLRPSFGQELVWILATIILIEICIFILVRFAILVKSICLYVINNYFNFIDRSFIVK